MGEIIVEGIKLYAYHGCLDEEARIGCDYLVDIYLETDFSKAAYTDDLSETIDYTYVYTIVKEQMAIRSKLIEHVANRIAHQLKSNLKILERVSVKVTKLNPPMNGHVEKVSVIIKQ